MLDALVASGLTAQPFIFIGFLPSAENERRKKLNEYRNYPMTMVFYEAPHRIHKCLASMLEILGDRKCCLARELTKVHEEFIRGTISEILEICDDLKGEMVVVVEGHTVEFQPDVDYSLIMNMVNESMANGMTKSEAIKDVAGRTGIARNTIYALVHGTSRC